MSQLSPGDEYPLARTNQEYFDTIKLSEAYLCHTQRGEYV